MSKIHYLIRRGRAGWFNFTLISEAGRLTGMVIVPPDGRSDEERGRQADEKIRKLADAFAQQQTLFEATSPPRRLHELGQRGIKSS